MVCCPGSRAPLWFHTPPLPCTHTCLPVSRADFGFDDNERDKYLGGYIAAAFYMVGAPAALLFGYLSDTVNRRNLLFVAVLLGGWMAWHGRVLGCGSEGCCWLAQQGSEPLVSLFPNVVPLVLSSVLDKELMSSACAPAGEGPCIMTYFVTQYWQLLVLRLLTGISLGGGCPGPGGHTTLRRSGA